MPTKTKAIVKIYGQEYAIVSDDDREHIQKVANLVDDQMKDIAAKNKKLSTAMVAVLTALNLADEWLKEREKTELLEKELQSPDQMVVELQKETANLREALKERAFEIERLEKARSESEKEAEGFKRNEARLQEAIASWEKNSDEEQMKRRQLEEKMEDLKNKLVDREVKLIQARKELQEFMDAFEK